jgi:SOS-response transcriptional repressor LexA
MTDFGKRIKQARKLAKLTQEQLAKAVGISQGSLSEMENEGLSSTYTVQIAHVCGVNAKWLATGVGGVALEEQNVTPVNFRAKVPVISWIQAGAFQGVEDVFQPGEADRYEDVRDTDVSGNAFALEVSGDSMVSSIPGDRSFPPGTIIVVDPNKGAGAGDYVIAKDVVTQQATFKKLMYDGGRWFLRPLNPIYPTTEIDDPDIRVIGKVVEYSLRGKLP